MDELDEAALRARVAKLEGERQRAFEDAQREADALFAQYQLSQLVASGGTVGRARRRGAPGARAPVRGRGRGTLTCSRPPESASTAIAAEGHAPATR